MRAALHRLPSEAFPVTIRIRSSKTNEVLWTRTIEQPPTASDLVGIEVPGFGGTEHAPVYVDIVLATDLA